ncbi:MAG: helix-turn-helix domain-containing protein [Chloroflexota bacterium]|nr:helix-turn-helix domain-containing protein [Chloroflexota bacterium]
MAEELNLQDPDWLAELLGIEKNTIYKFLGDGTIPALRLGKKWLVDPEDVRAFIATERRRQTVGRRAEAWLQSEIVRLGSRMTPVTPSASNDVKDLSAEQIANMLTGKTYPNAELVADTVKAIEHQVDEQGWAHMPIPDVALLMRQAGLKLVPCNGCSAKPVLYADADRFEPLCEECSNEEAARWEASPKTTTDEKGGPKVAQPSSEK